MLSTNLMVKSKRKEGPKVDRQADLDALKMNKISALPEFFDKVHNKMQKALDEWIDAPPVIFIKLSQETAYGILQRKKSIMETVLLGP